MTTPSSLETITCDEARSRLGMGRDAFRRAVREGKIPGFFCVGSRYFGVRGPFERWLAGDLVEAMPPPVPSPQSDRTIPFLVRRRVA